MTVTVPVVEPPMALNSAAVIAVASASLMVTVAINVTFDPAVIKAAVTIVITRDCDGICDGNGASGCPTDSTSSVAVIPVASASLMVTVASETATLVPEVIRAAVS